MLRASNVPGRIWVQFRIEDDYMEKEIDLRRLVIKAFHITEVEEGGENKSDSIWKDDDREENTG